MKHSFFLVMGGLCDDSGSVLEADDIFARLTGRNEIILTEADIEDKSKADGLTKGIAILQTTWFLVQCIARVTQKLPLTELEVVTLALGSLSVIMYIIWWEKPMDVRTAFYLPSQGIDSIYVFVLRRAPRRPSATGHPRYVPSVLIDQYSNFHSCLWPRSTFLPHMR